VSTAAEPRPALPSARGELSDGVIAALRGRPGHLAELEVDAVREPLADEDLQLALYLLYELHYRDYEDVESGAEWNTDLIALRNRLESAFDAALAPEVRPPTGIAPEAVGETLFEMARNDSGPSLSRFLETQGTTEQFREFLIQKSAYQLKEADPHSWVIPRITGRAKAAVMEIQYDEYGSGRPERIHSRLYAATMEALGLDSSYGAYLESIPGYTLATVNLTTRLGLHRDRRGALVGHLAMFEIGSAVPSRRYGNALRRLGMASREAVDFFDEHVEADSVHENIAAYDLAQRLALEEPHLVDDLLFGAQALLAIDGLFAEQVLTRWKAGESSLRSPDPVPA
jgi:hypothetical protein